LRLVFDFRLIFRIEAAGSTLSNEPEAHLDFQYYYIEAVVISAPVYLVVLVIKKIRLISISLSISWIAS
jgi:hypothetical protein